MQQTMIVSSTLPSAHRRDDDPIVVATPLDVIMRLEQRQEIRTVVLSGSFATNHELVAFLGECYPSVRVECEH